MTTTDPAIVIMYGMFLVALLALAIIQEAGRDRREGSGPRPAKEQPAQEIHHYLHRCDDLDDDGDDWPLRQQPRRVVTVDAPSSSTAIVPSRADLAARHRRPPDGYVVGRPPPR